MKRLVANSGSEKTAFNTLACKVRGLLTMQGTCTGLSLMLLASTIFPPVQLVDTNKAVKNPVAQKKAAIPVEKPPLVLVTPGVNKDGDTRVIVTFNRGETELTPEQKKSMHAWSATLTPETCPNKRIYGYSAKGEARRFSSQRADNVSKEFKFKNSGEINYFGDERNSQNTIDQKAELSFVTVTCVKEL